MFRRTFWFSTGVAAGVWATTKVNRKLNQLTPESLAAQAADRAVLAGRRVKLFALDVREGMADREAALRDALGLSAPPAPGPRTPELPGPRGRGRLSQTYPTHHRTTGKEDH